MSAGIRAFFSTVNSLLVDVQADKAIVVSSPYQPINSTLFFIV
jgi:hypothetical protein